MPCITAEREGSEMRWYRDCAAALLVPVLLVGLALGTPRPVRADDTGAFAGGAILGMLLSGTFDRDYPRGYSFRYTGEPTWYYYPSTGVYGFPPDAGPYPYNQRWWENAGNYQGRLVLMPARYPGSGERRALHYAIGNLGPIFLMPNDPRWARSTEYCADCVDNRIEPRLYGQYRWEPSLELGTYRRPATGWYNGPGPDWYSGREPDQRPLLEVGRPARADDSGAFVGGTILGMLQSGTFDQDYPQGYSYNYDGEPTWYYYPSVGVYAFPPDVGPYPYKQRWWEEAGHYQGRSVLVPARYPGSGERQVLRYATGTRGPIFLMPNDPRWARSTEYCADCVDNRIEPRLYGQYRWEPSLELGTYRRPATGWYNGPGPDSYNGRDRVQERTPEGAVRNRPDDRGAPADRGQAGQGRSDQGRSSTPDKGPAAGRDGNRNGEQPQQPKGDGKRDGGGDKSHGD